MRNLELEALKHSLRCLAAGQTMSQTGLSVQPGEVEMTAGATLPLHMLQRKVLERRGMSRTQLQQLDLGVFPHFCLLKYL